MCYSSLCQILTVQVDVLTITNLSKLKLQFIFLNQVSVEGETYIIQKALNRLLGLLLCCHQCNVIEVTRDAGTGVHVTNCLC
jgi:hypothetical protein